MLLEPVAVSASSEILEDADIDLETKKVTVDGKLVPDARIITEQFVPMGPAASQIAIKQTGTNGGGFFGVNSAHPFENPNALTNLLEMLSLLLIPMALFALPSARRSKKKAGYCNLLAMFLMLIASLSLIAVNEQSAATMLSPNNNVNMGMIDQAGGNMGGQGNPFWYYGIIYLGSFLLRQPSNGSVNSMHDSYTPLGGLAQMLQKCRLAK